jgi:NAD(P)-dependent dehydrogenase (short-subunit alcohol dehydrogenase family)
LKASQGSVVLISGSAALDPKPGFAAVAAVNAAIIALAKAFAEQGIKDGVQVNSVVPGAVMTGRRQSFFEKWAPAHNLTVEDKKFPEEAGISRFGKPKEIADLLGRHYAPWKFERQEQAEADVKRDDAQDPLALNQTKMAPQVNADAWARTDRKHSGNSGGEGGTGLRSVDGIQVPGEALRRFKL